ncbi:hypothetical protein [Streptomyces sp. NBC_01264]|uniref:hypothetical protein n=1 Tax=Streptomyces sp. NBC_01264 TaxID=2903804 RepID=UPI002253FE9D|nr:hypothetical protein [Streptomyces sp. NBC_01264]MCX4775817.1 hypothetical protein [Streptomyces sp. NBC_01264]
MNAPPPPSASSGDERSAQPAARWEEGDDAPTERQAAATRALLRLAATRLGGGPVVRGVLPLRHRRDLVRVVVGDAAAPTAYDVPLLDRDGNEVPAAGLPAAVRQLVRHAPGDRTHASDGPSAGRPCIPCIPDIPGIPVVTVDAVRLLLDAHPAELDLTDALHAAAATGIAPSADTDNQDGIVLLGFLLLHEERARLYLAGGGLADTIGLDVRLRDRDGTVVSAVTGLSAALPSLIANDQLQYNPSDETDPYCVEVFNLTHW